MDAVDLRTLADAVGGELRGTAGGLTGVHIDSRRCGEGDVFVALAGQRADGHDYVADLSGRASAAIVERWVDSPLPQCRVLSGRGALAALGRWNRERCPADVVGVTGSNGKTTVKALLAAILARAGTPLATEGNFNNELGVPLTLCRLERRHTHAVVEMGASGPGEIARLAAMARPRVGVITNTAAAHLEGFGSIAGVIAAKGELYSALPADGIAVVNGADPGVPHWRTAIGDRRVITFGVDDELADVVARGDGAQLRLDLGGHSLTADFALLGRHSRANAAAAVAAALAMEVPARAIRDGLADVTPVAGRLAPRRSAAGARLIDDSYNANPASLAAALAVLAEQPGEGWLVLGDMAELGDEAADRHHEAGVEARRLGVRRVFALGAFADEVAAGFGEGAEVFHDRGVLIDRLRTLDTGEQAMLVKGSRSAGMEEVVTALVAGGSTEARS